MLPISEATAMMFTPTLIIFQDLTWTFIFLIGPWDAEDKLKHGTRGLPDEAVALEARFFYLSFLVSRANFLAAL